MDKKLPEYEPKVGDRVKFNTYTMILKEIRPDGLRIWEKVYENEEKKDILLNG